MSYLAPPPMPQPVIVTKDVGGFVSDYQAQTEFYRATSREVRLHECRSACTLALSLPNVCVYRDSVLKFHLAYDPRNHQSNYDVSQQLFNSYPAAVRARLGGLTRDYRVLRGAELIALGVRDCEAPRMPAPEPSTPKIMLASAGTARTTPSAALRQQEPEGALSNLYNGVLSALGLSEETTPGNTYAPVRARPRPLPAQPGLFGAEVPVPPARPIDIDTQLAAARTDGLENESTMAEGAPNETIPAPPRRPSLTDLAYTASLPQVMQGAQPILPMAFIAYADLARARANCTGARTNVEERQVSTRELLFTPSDL